MSNFDALKFIQNQLNKNNELLSRINKSVNTKSVKNTNSVLISKPKDDNQIEQEPANDVKLNSIANSVQPVTRHKDLNSSATYKQTIAEAKLVIEQKRVNNETNRFFKSTQIAITEPNLKRQAMITTAENNPIENSKFEENKVIVQSLCVQNSSVLKSNESNGSIEQVKKLYSDNLVTVEVTNSVVTEKIDHIPNSEFIKPETSVVVEITAVCETNHQMDVQNGIVQCKTDPSPESPVSIKLNSNENISENTVSYEAIAEASDNNVDSMKTYSNLEEKMMLCGETSDKAVKILSSKKRPCIKRLQTLKKHKTTALKGILKLNFKLKFRIDALHMQFVQNKFDFILNSNFLRHLHLFNLIQNFDKFYVNPFKNVYFIEYYKMKLVKPFEFVLYFKLYSLYFIKLIFKYFNEKNNWFKTLPEFLQINLDFTEFFIEDTQGLFKHVNKTEQEVEMVEAGIEIQSVNEDSERMACDIGVQTTQIVKTDLPVHDDGQNNTIVVPDVVPEVVVIEETQEKSNQSSLHEEQVVPLDDEARRISVEEIEAIRNLIINRNEPLQNTEQQILSPNIEQEQFVAPLPPLPQVQATASQPQVVAINRQSQQQPPSQSRPPKRRKFMRVGLSKRQRIKKHLHDTVVLD